MRITRHAKQRWAERFPELDLEEVYEHARYRRVGKKTKRMVAAACPAHKHYCSGLFNGRYLRMTREGILFVVAPPETIITVMDFRR